MKLIAQLKLLPTPEQANALKRTLEQANAACNDMSRVAWETQTFGKYELQKALYHRIRATYGLSAQLVIRCLAKVADSYKLDRKVPRSYTKHGSIAYDDRILSFQPEKQTVSLWTLSGRQSIPFVCGPRQMLLLQTRQGESDLVFRKGTWYLLAVCVVDEPTPDEIDGVLGVDLGIVNFATDSDGESFSGTAIDQRRQWYAGRRSALQAVGTRSAKRRLKKLSGGQRRFQSDTNHVISKRLVAKAKGSARGIALEELTHIRERITVRHTQRARQSNWAFGQLRQFISYKAALQGVCVSLVDPRNTSRTCTACGCCEKSNRPNQATFRCVSCGHASPADVNAALNIAYRGGVMLPMVSVLRDQMQAVGL